MTPTSFADQFRTPLPRELRDQAARLSWDGFVSAYGRTAGPVRLGRWCCLDTGRWGAGAQGHTYQATIDVAGRTDTCTAAAQGPLAALTAMLHDRGVALEMLAFHQYGCDGRTVTFIHGSDGRHDEWAMGCSEDSGQSALDAVIGCANRLLTES